MGDFVDLMAAMCGCCCFAISQASPALCNASPMPCSGICCSCCKSKREEDSIYDDDRSLAEGPVTRQPATSQEMNKPSGPDAGRPSSAMTRPAPTASRTTNGASTS